MPFPHRTINDVPWVTFILPWVCRYKLTFVWFLVSISALFHINTYTKTERLDLMTTINYYPGDLPGQPFVKFSTWKMKGGTGSNIGDIGMTAIGDHVCLPIPSGVNVTYGQGWDQEEVGAAKSLGAATASEAMDSLSPESGVLDNVKAMAKGGWEQVKESLGNTGVAAAGKAAGMLAVGKVVGQGALQRATGAAAFSNTYATYGGPAFRTFQFAFSMKPLSWEDNVKIIDIVSFFKEGSAPDLITGGLWRVYELPYVFTITFYDNEGVRHHHLPMISQSALTDVSVTYGGDMYSEFENGAPVQTDIQLSFREIALLSKADMQTNFY